MQKCSNAVATASVVYCSSHTYPQLVDRCAKKPPHERPWRANAPFPASAKGSRTLRARAGPRVPTRDLPRREPAAISAIVESVGTVASYLARQVPGAQDRGA